MCFSLRKTQMQLALFVKKHILLFSRPACCGNLTWWNLKGLAELANLTVCPKTVKILAVKGLTLFLKIVFRNNVSLSRYRKYVKIDRPSQILTKSCS